MEITKEMLDAPAFGKEAIPAEETAPASESLPEREEESTTSRAEEEQAVEQRVPYSRFKSVQQRALDAERDAQEARERLSELSRREPTRDEPQGDLPNYWVKLYGDSDASKEAFKYELERQDQFKREAREAAIEAVRNERTEESRAIESNLETLDSQTESLSEYLGRDITEKEELAVLEIVDKYTPKDRDGNYAGEIMSFDNAWEIYELQQAKQGLSASRARAGALSATGSRSDGEPNGKISDDSNFNPQDWNAWRKRVTN